jgi:flagellar biosynthesis/type III secretory pathway ATPase
MHCNIFGITRNELPHDPLAYFADEYRLLLDIHVILSKELAEGQRF